jgi:hypothetical protein
MFSSAKLNTQYRQGPHLLAIPSRRGRDSFQDRDDSAAGKINDLLIEQG